MSRQYLSEGMPWTSNRSRDNHRSRLLHPDFTQTHAYMLVELDWEEHVNFDSWHAF